MAKNPTVWGVHMGDHVGDRPTEGGYVAIGWHQLGDIRKIAGTREAFKAALVAGGRGEKEGAVPVHAGILYRFAFEMQPGDVVIYPSKHDRMVNIGIFTGETAYVEGDADEYPNRRGVKWLGHFPRNDFSQSALNEIGSAVTLFKVKRHAGEFLAKVGIAGNVAGPEAVTDTLEEAADDDTATVAVSRQAEETTGDFVIRRIMGGMSGYEFEAFVAHLMECMGYRARVTPKSADGGVDVIAHMDALGFQPPIVKVQCKRKTDQTSRPDVDQLLGTLGEGEYGLYVNLGSYSRSAVELERNRAKLRLIDGEQFVEMVLSNYGKLAPRYRSLIPLKQIYVPDLTDG
ncbi:restriction endonuclease [Tabrizicola sp.]|uniref:restriction endonuclease n=1 Tax=Tabrizicola sp. TaxID=2005166 RepID=UPI002FDDAF78